MPDLLHMIDQLLKSGSSWLYAALFVTALLEGFVLTSFFVSGTIAIAVIGALVGQGYLHPLYAFVCLYAGTLLGDSLSYFLSTRIQHSSWLAPRLDKFKKYRAPLLSRPYTFTVLGHLTPYLKGINAFLAGGVLPWRVWLLADVVGALCGILFFGGMGAASSYLVTSETLNAIQISSVLVVLSLIIFLWIRSTNSCSLRGGARSPSPFCPQHRNWKRVFFFLYFIPWYFVRKIESRLRKLETRALRKDLHAEFPDVRAGDIFLVRLHSPAPWGTWAHSAIALGSNRFCHGFGKTITEHRLEALPIRYAIVHLRVRCDENAALAASTAAAKMIGRPVSIWARKGDTSRFSCASLIYHAYASAGVALSDQDFPRVVPDDIFGSAKVDVVRVVFTERIRLHATRKGVVAYAGNQDA